MSEVTGTEQRFQATERKRRNRRVYVLPEEDILLTPAEAAVYFKVDPKTMVKWADAGKIRSTRTLGGHRRIYLAAVKEALAGANVTR